MLLINNDDVQKLLDMKTCLEALEQGYQDLAVGNAVHRPRIDVWAPCERSDGYFRWGSMEGVCRSYGVFAIRMKSDIVYWPDGKNELKYSIQPGTYCGLIMLFSIQNGEPLAIINDGYLQHMRVGGGAGLGVKYLARPDAAVVGIIGSGGMARTYLQAFAEVRSLARVKVYSRSRERRETYAAEMRERLRLPIDVYDNPEPVVRGSDIVATCTDSIVPVLTEPNWLEEGTHLTNLSVREFADEQIFNRCDVIVRLGDQTLASRESDAGFRPFHMAGYIAGQPEELARIPRAKVEINVERHPRLVEIVSGKAPGRTSPHQITCFINIGTQGLQFASVGGRVYHLARERGIGRELPTEWFIQDIRD
jgi:ornithine cyclodeaminase/alanine dehydrogenase-like protein (mu-crystallin family)